MNLAPLSRQGENIYTLPEKGIFALYFDEPAELSNMPGIFVRRVLAYFYQMANGTIHVQMFFMLSEGAESETVYGAADSVRIDVSFDKCTERSGGNA